MYKFVTDKSQIKPGDKVTLIDKNTGGASVTGRIVSLVFSHSNGGFEFAREPGELVFSVHDVDSKFHILMEKGTVPESWPPQIDDIWETEPGNFWHYLDNKFIQHSAYAGTVSVATVKLLDLYPDMKLVYRKG